MRNNQKIEHAYEMAKDVYAQWGVDVEDVLKQMDLISVSLPCWQGDDVAGFEKPDERVAGGFKSPEIIQEEHGQPMN